MKKLLLSTALLALTAGAALAADLPSRKAPVLPPPPPPPPMWTGFYVGLNAGGTWANSNGQYQAVGPVAASADWPHAGNVGAGLETNAFLAAFSQAASASGSNSGSNGGFIGGGQIGYNWQFMNSFVAGLEADIQGVASSGNNRGAAVRVAPVGLDTNGISSNYVGATTASGSLQYLGTVRGRLGWLAMPTLLLYGTGGLAYGGVSLRSATMVYNDAYVNIVDPALGAHMPASFGGVNFSNTQVGWTAGGGIEWMFMPNWSAKVEYLYYDLGTVTQNFGMAAVDNFADPVPTAAIFGGQVRARINGNIVRAGVNYHFNWGAAPVVAKY